MAIDQNAQKSLFNDTLKHDFLCDDEELQSLFIKEKETCFTETRFIPARKETVEWILKVKTHYEFSALTAIFAVNYLDRFIYSFNFEKIKEPPWMMQLAAVTCLSLAAKVEETHVPFLLDLQVEDTKYVFEAKTIQRMEVLVLSSLSWRMNPVTPLSFIDYVIRVGLKSDVHWELLKSCENLLLSIISDSGFVRYLPSVLATATMLHIIHQVEDCNNAIDYENQLLGVLKVSKEEVDDCYEFMSDILSNTELRIWQVPSSPSGVMDAFFCYDSSNDS